MPETKRRGLGGRKKAAPFRREISTSGERFDTDRVLHLKFATSQRPSFLRLLCTPLLAKREIDVKRSRYRRGRDRDCYNQKVI